MSTPERLLSFIHYTRMEDMKICFDVGHAHMVGSVQDAFETLKDRICSTHVHDNKKEKDDHLLPFDGDINWEDTVRGFRSVDGQFPVLFEVRKEESAKPEKSTLARLREVMEKMENIA